jgi:uncharacterized phage protein (TIGR02220 family)
MSIKHPLLNLIAMIVLKNLNIWTGSRFRPVEPNLKPIKQCLASGATLLQCLQINGKKSTEWANKRDRDGNLLSTYLRPKTLYARTNFEQYLGELKNDNS